MKRGIVITYFQISQRLGLNDFILTELCQKSQITIPKELIVKLCLSEEDMLDIFEKDGTICMMPVAVYPKKYLDELRDGINIAKTKIASGKQPVFDKNPKVMHDFRYSSTIGQSS